MWLPDNRAAYSAMGGEVGRPYSFIDDLQSRIAPFAENMAKAQQAHQGLALQLAQMADNATPEQYDMIQQVARQAGVQGFDAPHLLDRVTEINRKRQGGGSQLIGQNQGFNSLFQPPVPTITPQTGIAPGPDLRMTTFGPSPVAAAQAPIAAFPVSPAIPPPRPVTLGAAAGAAPSPADEPVPLPLANPKGTPKSIFGSVIGSSNALIQNMQNRTNSFQPMLQAAAAKVGTPQAEDLVDQILNGSERVAGRGYIAARQMAENKAEMARMKYDIANMTAVGRLAMEENMRARFGDAAVTRLIAEENRAGSHLQAPEIMAVGQAGRTTSGEAVQGMKSRAEYYKQQFDVAARAYNLALTNQASYTRANRHPDEQVMLDHKRAIAAAKKEYDEAKAAYDGEYKRK